MINEGKFPGAADVLTFWFAEYTRTRWFAKDPDFDELLRARFGNLHAHAVCCELFQWRKEPEGRLAEIIVLDQFSRNIYRDRAEAFAADALALALAQEAVSVGADLAIEAPRRSFFYMPYMHSESLIIHDVAVELFERSGNPNMLEFEHRHRSIIERFGRYPHRNAVLERVSTPEELGFLEQPGSGF